jgi:fructose-bisphosphate aldolase, class I
MERGIVPGVKPHLKVYKLFGASGDTVMQGLDSLAVRCREYYQAGARFAKWPSPLEIDMGNGRPSNLAKRSNMHDLARYYAIIRQSEGIRCPLWNQILA